MTDQTESKIRVLVADDDTPTRMLLRAAISQWGYVVTEAKNGEEAWEILQQENPPRLLIVDWLMPELDGIALCERIKQKMPKQFHIILLTQMTGSANILKGYEAGADEFLSKPFNMVELRSKLSVGAKIIQSSNGSQENSTASPDATKKDVTTNYKLNSFNDLIMILETVIKNKNMPGEMHVINCTEEKIDLTINLNLDKNKL